MFSLQAVDKIVKKNVSEGGAEILGLIAAIYKFAGKQELYLKQRPNELEKLVEIAKRKVLKIHK